MNLPSFVYGIVFAVIGWGVLLFIQFLLLSHKKSKIKKMKVVKIPSFDSVFNNLARLHSEPQNELVVNKEKEIALDFYDELVWQIRFGAHTSVKSIEVKL